MSAAFPGRSETGGWAALGRGSRRALQKQMGENPTRTCAADSHGSHHSARGVIILQAWWITNHPAYRFAVTVRILTGSFPV
jgi:hypothetical protein